MPDLPSSAEEFTCSSSPFPSGDPALFEGIRASLFTHTKTLSKFGLFAGAAVPGDNVEGANVVPAG
jgi:hypothetical protein